MSIPADREQLRRSLSAALLVGVSRNYSGLIWSLAQLAKLEGEAR